MQMLESLGLMDELPWFKMKRWLYHVIKILTGATLAFVLNNCGVSLLWASAIGMIGPVLVSHIIVAVIGKYPFNTKDTIFDILLSTITFNTVIVKMWGWTCGIAGLVLYSILLIVLLKKRWNSP